VASTIRPWRFPLEHNGEIESWTDVRWKPFSASCYPLILRSRKAVTPGTVQHRFRKWVTAEVLPALRRSGRYGAPADPVNPDLVEVLTQAVTAQRTMAARNLSSSSTRGLGPVVPR
jgi:hypothetical protein